MKSSAFHLYAVPASSSGPCCAGWRPARCRTRDPWNIPISHWNPASLDIGHKHVKPLGCAKVQATKGKIRICDIWWYHVVFICLSSNFTYRYHQSYHIDTIWYHIGSVSIHFVHHNPSLPVLVFTTAERRTSRLCRTAGSRPSAFLARADRWHPPQKADRSLVRCRTRSRRRWKRQKQWPRPQLI